MARLLLNFVVGALILFLVLLILARWQERNGLFFPSRELYRSPATEGLAFEDVNLISDGHIVHGWYMPGSAQKAVLWMHGNAGNIADRLDQAVEMKRALGVSSLMFDYRGYGKSEGRPTEEGLYRDSAAAFNWLIGERGYEPEEVILYGHSLGSAPAVDLALGAGTGAGGLVLESSFTSAAAMARRMYFGLPIHLIMSVRLDNVGRISGVKMPLLVIHGDRDSVVPFRMGRELYEAAPEPKTFLPLSGGEHSDCYYVGGEAYWSAWKELLDQAGAQSP